MLIVERAGRALAYLTCVVCLIFSLWVGFWVFASCYSAFLGEEYFEAEDIPLPELATYDLPPHDRDLVDMEAVFTLEKRRNPAYESTMNF